MADTQETHNNISDYKSGYFYVFFHVCKKKKKKPQLSVPVSAVIVLTIK